MSWKDFWDTIQSDYQAVFDRDPAAKTTFGAAEVLLCYSGYHAILWHRFIHFLHAKVKIPILPRFMAQVVRWFTGVEIHPGAEIGKNFFIDHGMGVVIGETTVIGNSVTLYQGVTLGGTGKERGKRHPTLGDNVVVGAGAKVLGNIFIGNGSRIGAGSVVIESVPDNCTVVGVPGEIVKRGGTRVVSLDHADLPDPVKEVKDRLILLQREVDLIESDLEEFRKKKKN